MENINIMTACNEGYAKYILPQLVSIHKNIGEYKVNFFLLYNRITPETIDLIKTFSDKFENIDFFPCYVDKNIEKYTTLASSGGGGNKGIKFFPYETYFTLDCQNYLPEWVDRALYIHSADIIFLEDISDFYFSSFKGKSLNVEVSTHFIIKKHKDGKPVLYSSKERVEFIRTRKLNTTYFNSGAFMVNVKKFREQNTSLDHYLKIRDEVILNLPEVKDGKYYNGDQGFYAVAFLGDINNFQEITRDLLGLREHTYSPIVIKSREMQKKSEVKKPKVLHYDDRFKPWSIAPDFFQTGIPQRVNKENFIKGFHRFGPIVFHEFYEMYWEFVKETPIYDEMLKEAQLISKWAKNIYIPILNSDIIHRQKVLELEKELEKHLELEKYYSDLEKDYVELEMKVKNYKEALQSLLD